jgi:23S rRNA (uridine2552-2'-O)-methyltransferase
LSYNPRDHYFKKAKAENFVARSIFKLEELDEKYSLFKKGQSVLDLGASPGSWSQYASKKIGGKGRIVGIDLKEIEISLPNAEFIIGDIADTELSQSFDIVISDMAPKTTGVKVTDQARSIALCELARDKADSKLKPSGHFVCKLFQSDDFHSFKKSLMVRFEKVHIVKPKGTRKTSSEIFFVGLNKKS